MPGRQARDAPTQGILGLVTHSLSPRERAACLFLISWFWCLVGEENTVVTGPTRSKDNPAFSPWLTRLMPGDCAS